MQVEAYKCGRSTFNIRTPGITKGLLIDEIQRDIYAESSVERTKRAHETTTIMRPRLNVDYGTRTLKGIGNKDRVHSGVVKIVKGNTI